MYDDTFNLMGIHGGGCTSSTWTKLFCIFGSGSENKVSLGIFSIHNHTFFFAFWNSFLVSHVEDMIKSWNLWKDVSFTKKSWLMRSFSFLDDIFKSLSLVCKIHTSHIIDCHHYTRDIPGTNFKLIPFLEAEKLYYHIIPCMLIIVEKRCTFK